MDLLFLRKRYLPFFLLTSLPPRFLAGVGDEAQKNGKILDATGGKKTRTVIVTTSDHIILSAIAAEALHRRLESSIKRES
jgi:regulator of extracellular matrix RemA (YlzA/DUF370 family)